MANNQGKQFGRLHTHTQTGKLPCFIMQICGKLFSNLGNCQCFFKSFCTTRISGTSNTHTLPDSHTHIHTWVCVPANSYLYNLIVSCTIPYLGTCRHTTFAVCVCDCVCVCSLVPYDLMNSIRRCPPHRGKLLLLFLALKNKFPMAWICLFSMETDRKKRERKRCNTIILPGLTYSIRFDCHLW